MILDIVELEKVKKDLPVNAKRGKIFYHKESGTEWTITAVSDSSGMRNLWIGNNVQVAL